MAQTSTIEWTDATWNPVTGCSKISIGCEHCYAERMARRLQAMGQHRYMQGFKVTVHNDLLNQPIRWRRPRRIFVNSMSDLFHRDVPFEFIQDVFDVIQSAHWHLFQILTKRSRRLQNLSPKLNWPDNLWIGVTVENEENMSRIHDLTSVPAAVKFISFEPLLGPICNLSLKGIDWVILGGESGPGARYMRKEWARSIRDQCLKWSVPFFFKQWGGVWKSRNGRSLDGRTWDEIPAVAKSSSETRGQVFD